MGSRLVFPDARSDHCQIFPLRSPLPNERARAQKKSLKTPPLAQKFPSAPKSKQSSSKRMPAYPPHGGKTAALRRFDFSPPTETEIVAGGRKATTSIFASYFRKQRRLLFRIGASPSTASLTSAIAARQALSSRSHYTIPWDNNPRDEYATCIRSVESCFRDLRICSPYVCPISSFSADCKVESPIHMHTHTQIVIRVAQT